MAGSDDARWYIPIFGLLIVRTQDQSRGVPSPLVWALALAAALSIHAKGNLFIATGVVAVALLAADLLQRRIPWTVLLIAAFTTGLLYLGGGDLAGFARYTIHVVESTRAYPEAFSQSDSAWAPALFLLGVACAGLARCLQIRHRWQWPLALAFGVLLFLLYKGAFVRHDAIHVIRSWTTVLLVVGTEIVAAICCWWACAIPRWRAKSAVGLAIASLALCSTPLSDWYARDILARDLQTQPTAAAKFARTPLKLRQWYFEQQWARVRHHAPLPDIDGSVTTIGTYYTPILAHGLRSETVPVVAHYEVWSPRTVAAIDRYLESDEAPQFLFRTANYPSVSNELSVARLYRPIVAEWYYTLLERRTEPLAVSSETLFEGDVGWNEPIEIPSEHRDSLLVAEVRFHRNVGGRLVGLFHHPPPVQMVLEKSDGSEASVRLNSLLSEQGVVAAAEVPDPDYGAHLRRRRYTGDDAPQTIIEGHWGGSGAALHLARHPVLTEVESNVRRIRFRAQTLGWDASALFAPELHVRIRVVSLLADPQP